MLRTALSNSNALAANAPSLLPADFTWGAFKRVLGLSDLEEAQAEGGSGAAINFWLYLRNSVIVATRHHRSARSFFSAMAAYAFARLRWPGRDLVFAPVPGRPDGPADLHRAAQLPADQAPRPAEHLPGIILPFFFMTPFAIFFLRQFFLGISPGDRGGRHDSTAPGISGSSSGSSCR